MVQRIGQIEAGGVVVQRLFDLGPVFDLYMGKGENVPENRQDLFSLETVITPHDPLEFE